MKVIDLLNLCENNLTVFQFEEFSTGKYLGSFFFSELKESKYYYSHFYKFKISHSYEYGFTIWIYI